MFLDDKTLKYLEKQANLIRRSVIEMLMSAGSGHTAGALGMADVLTALYFNILIHEPKHPNWPERIELFCQMAIFARSCMPRWHIPVIFLLAS